MSHSSQFSKVLNWDFIQLLILFCFILFSIAHFIVRTFSGYFRKWIFYFKWWSDALEAQYFDLELKSFHQMGAPFIILFFCSLFFKPSRSRSRTLQVPLSSAGLLDWSCYSSTCAARSVTFWPMRSFSFCLPSSTLPWTPSSTPTATKRWAPPSGRSCAASAVRTPAAPRKARTAPPPLSTTPSWRESTAMTTPWFRTGTKMRGGRHPLRDEQPPPPHRPGQGGVWERGKIPSCT